MFYLSAFLSGLVPKEPGIFIGPISQVFGYVIDFIFNIVYSFTVNNSLGLTIVFLTIFFRILMLPLGIKSQKSMMKMQKLNPEVEKIRQKYGNSKDPEIAQKMNIEIQALYSKNKVNPLSGCLPILIQFPLFMGINYIMQQAYRFIPKLHDIYTQLSTTLISAFDASLVGVNIADGAAVNNTFFGYVKNVLANPHIPKDMNLDVWLVEDLSKALSKFTTADWKALFTNIPAEFATQAQEIYNLKESVEVFFGLPLVDQVGLMWPGILIPILAGLTSFITPWLTNKISKPADDRARSQQRMMMIVMPIVMVFMTFSLAGGVGIYWITSSVFQIVQQIIMNHQAGIPLFKKKDEVTIE